MNTYKIQQTKSNYHVLILFLLLALSCLSFNTSHAQYTGEDLFRAVYFGEGTAAGEIAELEGVSIRNYTNDATELRDAMALQDQLVTAIHASNARFMVEFQQAMTSGNHVTIRAKLNEGQEVLSSAASSLGMERDLALESDLADAVTRSLRGTEATTANVGQAVRDYFAQQDASNSNNPALRLKYIRFIAFAFIIVVIEWYFDPMEDFALAYQDQLVNSIARKF